VNNAFNQNLNNEFKQIIEFYQNFAKLYAQKLSLIIKDINGPVTTKAPKTNGPPVISTSQPQKTESPKKTNPQLSSSLPPNTSKAVEQTGSPVVSSSPADNWGSTPDNFLDEKDWKEILKYKEYFDNIDRD